MEHIFNIWPKMSDLAADLGLSYQTVAAWKRRGRVPPDRDFELIAAATRRGGVLTLEELARARVARSQPPEDAA